MSKLFGATYRSRTSCNINMEASTLIQIRELCRYERKTLSEKIGELMNKELEAKKNVLVEYA